MGLDSEMQHALVESLKYNETYVMPFWSKDRGAKYVPMIGKITIIKITFDSF